MWPGALDCCTVGFQQSELNLAANKTKKKQTKNKKSKLYLCTYVQSAVLGAKGLDLNKEDKSIVFSWVHFTEWKRENEYMIKCRRLPIALIYEVSLCTWPCAKHTLVITSIAPLCTPLYTHERWNWRSSESRSKLLHDITWGRLLTMRSCCISLFSKMLPPVD